MIKCLLIIAVILFSSCNKPNKKLKETINSADSVVINYFKGDGTMDTVLKVKIVRDSQTIHELGSLISAASVKGNYKCGYDGSLHFFKQNLVILDIDFRMNEPACMYFTFKQLGQTGATILSEDAKQLLKTIGK